MDDLNKKYYELNSSLEDSLDDNELSDSDIIDSECQENCVNCFFSNVGYCPVQQKHITKYTPICWSFRDCFTMRTSSDFQDDNEDFYEYEQGDVFND